MVKTTKLVLLSQVVFLVLIGVCVAILPHFLFARNEGGMSNYGVHASTVVFYTLAFVTSAGLLIYAARNLPSSPAGHRRLKTVMWTTAYSMLLVLLTTYPYQHSDTLGNIHTAANIWIFCFETVAAGWMALVFHRSVISILLLLLQLVTFVLLVLTFIGTIHLLFVAQILTLLAFGLLLTASTTSRLTNK